VNRVRIMDLPGVALEPEVRGRTAADLLSTAALAERLRPDAVALGLSAQAAAEPAHLVRAFDGCFVAEDPVCRALAEQHADCFGRFLGYLLVTLRRGDVPNRQARAEWDDTYWAHWAAVRRVVLGGGICSGHLGRRVARSAAALLAEHSTPGLTLHLAAYPAHLPLIGAARSAPASCRVAVVLDCGHSAIKRGCAVYEAGTLVALRLLPSLAAPAAGDTAEPRERQALRRATHLGDLLADTWHAARGLALPRASVGVVSVATYTREDHPLPGQGGLYGPLQALDQNAAAWLTHTVSARVGEPLAVRLLHDGTAAAQAMGPADRSATLLLGTALGVGFAPRRASLRPLSPHFSVA